MARRRVSDFFCLFLLSIFIVSSCGLFSENYGKYKKLRSEELGNFHFSRRELVQFFFPKETIHEKIEPPVIYPAPPNIPAPPFVNIPPPPAPLITVIPNPTTVPGANPSTTPVTSPDNNPTAVPGANPSATPVTVPNTNPTTVPGANPSATPVTVPNTNPTTVPGANPSATPVTVPNTNPNTSSPPPPSSNPVIQPVISPPATTIPPPNPGRGWCVAKSGAPQAGLQAALDYACGVGGVDCSAIQQGGSCYNPMTLENYASYAFNSYYQRNPVPTSCVFGGTAMIITNNPSTGSCIFPTSSSTPASSVPSPVTQIPTQTPPTTPAIPTPPALSAPPAAPIPPAFSTPPTALTPPAFPAPLAAPTPPAFPTPPASPTPPSSLRPPASPAVPRASGAPVSANSTNNTASGFPMGGFPNIFPIVNTSMPPDSAPSVTSMSKPSTLPQPFIGGITLVTIIVAWNYVFDP